MPSSYDSWLEAPYQRACADADEYEAAFEQECERIRAELEQLSVLELLQRCEAFTASPNAILALSQREPLQPYQTYHFSLDSVIQALAANLAETALQSAPQEYDGPEPDDFDCSCPDQDQDCDYWRRTK